VTVPRTVGHYEILRELGRGGMGRVHLAREVKLGRDVALKAVGGPVDSQDATARFLREARLAGSLSHPNIVTVFEYVEVDAVPYIAMEYVPGGSLRPYLAGLDMAGFAGVMEGVLAGLAHAQRAGVVHRDLKPENIMVTAEGGVKIGDFGLAKATEIAATESFATRSGAIVGTPRYMAPEQILGGEVGTWSDLYSLGVMAYEQIVGCLPFDEADAPTAILMRHINEGIPSAVDVRHDVDPEISRWLDQLLAKDPVHRIREPLEAWEQLEEIVLRLLGPRWRRTSRLPVAATEARIQTQTSPSAASVQTILTGSQVMHALYRSGRQADARAVDRELSGRLPTPTTSLRRGSRLPHPATPFLGRARELRETGALLRRSEARLLTLTGAGGCGKTRLALELAHRSVEYYGDGVAFVPLADLTDEALIAPTICQALGLAERTILAPAEQLRERLADGDLLLVLDNCEHLAGAVAELVASVLSDSPSASVLATSREPLRIEGEHVYRVSSMSLPSDSTDDLGHVRRAEAVQLFVARASQQRPTFTLDETTAAAVARICRKLDGLPMAIELAAVRVRSMSIAELDARLDDRFALLRSGARNAAPRQQTLHALIDWSYQLLTEPERLLLARLSVFPASGFDLEAAEATCFGDARGIRLTLYDLDALVDKSLVQAEDSFGAVRYRLLETVREYASARLADSGEGSAAAARSAHRRHYLALAESVRGDLRGPDRRARLTRLADEQDNLRIAFEDCLRDPSPQPGLQFVDALREFWASWAPAADALRLIARLLERPDAQDPSLARGRALVVASHLCFRPLGDYANTVAYAEQALAVGRRQQDDHLCGDALNHLAWGELRRAQLTESLDHSRAGLEIARSVDDRRLLVELLIGHAAALSNASDEARALLLEALEVAQEAHDPHLTAMSLGNLGYLDLVTGDPLGAREQLETALQILLRLDEIETVAALINLGFATHLAGDPATAASRFHECLKVGRRLGDPEALALAVLGLAVTSPEPTTAAALHGTSDALLQRFHLVLDPVESQLRDDDRARLNATLGSDAFEHAYAAARSYDPNDSVSLVLSRSIRSDS
jgi:predicted ATPase